MLYRVIPAFFNNIGIDGNIAYVIFGIALIHAIITAPQGIAGQIGDLMGSVVVPFMPLQKEEDYEQLVELGKKIVDFFAENALEHERTGEMIERIGLVNFLEGVGLDVNANMAAAPRTNPYVRTDGWDDEVARIKAGKAAA